MTDSIDVETLVNRGSLEEIELSLAALAEDSGPTSLGRLVEFLRVPDRDTYHKPVVPRLAALALLRRGAQGVEALGRAFRTAPGVIYATAVIETLWYAAKGLTPPPMLRAGAGSRIGSPVFGADMLVAAQRAIREILSECLVDENRSICLVQFMMDQVMTSSEPESLAQVIDVLAEGRIKLTRGLLEEYEALIGSALDEETYQKFLMMHPVFLDPLAAEVIPKGKLGLEHVTDFVVRRHDNIYLLVEIEKPQDRIFTATNDFTAQFTHAFGQVIDFLRWVEKNAEYARQRMPDIASPIGMLIMGQRRSLSADNLEKLRYFAANCGSVEVLAFDDLLVRTRTLYASVFRRPAAPGGVDLSRP
jgi:hypothetical protein